MVGRELHVELFGKVRASSCWLMRMAVCRFENYVGALMGYIYKRSCMLDRRTDDSGSPSASRLCCVGVYACVSKRLTKQEVSRSTDKIYS